MTDTPTYAQPDSNAEFAAANCINITRFWSKVVRLSPDGCWEWRGATNRGYGQFHIGKSHSSVMLSHRVAYGLTYGTLPEAVCHRCDNPLCCNPSHLFGGTRADNNRDMHDKNRHAKELPGLRGQKHHMAKLSDDDVESIRAQYAEGGVTQRDLAKRYGVCQRSINKAVRNISFKNVR